MATRPDAGLRPARTLGLLLLTLLLGGCGFQLRAPAQLPPDLLPVHVQAGPGSRIAGVLARALRNAEVAVTGNPREAGVVVRIEQDFHEERVSAVNSTGKVIGNELRYQVTFDAVRRGGAPFAERQTIVLTRDYVNPEVEVLGKTEEAALIRQDMERDMADRILYRLRTRLQNG